MQRRRISVVVNGITNRTNGTATTTDAQKFALDDSFLSKAKVNEISPVIERQGESFSYDEVIHYSPF